MEPAALHFQHTLSKFALACPKKSRVSGQPRGVEETRQTTSSWKHLADESTMRELIGEDAKYLTTA